MSYTQIFARYDANPWRNSPFSAANRFRHLEAIRRLRGSAQFGYLSKTYVQNLAESYFAMTAKCQKPRLPR